MSIIDNDINKIKSIYDKHKVAKLFVFGSVLTDKFENNSDIDFLVDFSRVANIEYHEKSFT